MQKEKVVSIEGKEISLTNLDKIFWPESGLTKAHLIKYYMDMAPYVLPYIKDRPLVMKRYPDGIRGDSFYQKECPDYAPDWLQVVPVQHSRKVIRYITCSDAAALAWLANQGCIELHAWLSSVHNVDYPDTAVMDLDPAEGAGFKDVIKTALLVKEILAYFDLECYIKTSGSNGLHVFIPVLPEYRFKEVTGCMKYVAGLAVQASPGQTTMERKVSRRYGKVYLDYLQNTRGKTMAFTYSLRPYPGAPVSTPLRWEEVSGLSSSRAYNINNIKDRITTQQEDPWQGMLHCRQSLQGLARKSTSKAFARV